MLEVLKEVRAYAHVVAADVLSKKAEEIIDSYDKARVYQSLDGTRSDSIISTLTGVPRRTVTSWVSEFAKCGLATTGKRFEVALFTLEELGLSLKTMKKKSRRNRPSPEKEEPGVDTDSMKESDSNE